MAWKVKHIFAVFVICGSVGHRKEHRTEKIRVRFCHVYVSCYSSLWLTVSLQMCKLCKYQAATRRDYITSKVLLLRIVTPISSLLQFLRETWHAAPRAFLLQPMCDNCFLNEYHGKDFDKVGIRHNICEPSRVLSNILLSILLTFGNSNLSLVLVAAHDQLQTHFLLGISWA